MAEPTVDQQRKSDRLFKMGIGMALLFAVTWGLPGFFNWTTLGLTVYLFFLSWYHKPKTQEEPRHDSFARKRTDHTKPADMQEHRQAMGRRVAVVVALVVFGFFFLLFFIGIIADDDSQIAVETPSEDYYTDEDRELIRENPNDLDALTRMADRFNTDGPGDSAEVYYNRILKLDRQNEKALYDLGLLYYNQTEYQKSIDLLKQCIQAHPDNGDAYLILGHDYYDQQRLDDAFVWYSKSYEKGVRIAFLSHVLAYLYDNKGNTARAIPFYKEALELDSTRSDIYTRLAELEPANADRYQRMAARWKTEESN